MKLIDSSRGDAIRKAGPGGGSAELRALETVADLLREQNDLLRKLVDARS